MSKAHGVIDGQCEEVGSAPRPGSLDERYVTGGGADIDRLERAADEFNAKVGRNSRLIIGVPNKVTAGLAALLATAALGYSVVREPTSCGRDNRGAYTEDMLGSRNYVGPNVLRTDKDRGRCIIAATGQVLTWKP